MLDFTVLTPLGSNFQYVKRSLCIIYFSNDNEVKIVCYISLGIFGARPDQRNQEKDQSAEEEFTSVVYGNGKILNEDKYKTQLAIANKITLLISTSK